MTPSLTSYRTEFQSRLLAVLWRQWTTLGVAGHDVPCRSAIIDPEALLLLSCTVARHDARLFDAMLEWVRLNGRFLNIQRIKRMLGEEPFSGGPVFQAIATVIQTPETTAKWQRSATFVQAPSPQPMFFLDNGKPMPVLNEPDPLFASAGFLRDPYVARGVAHTFRPDLPPNLLLRLRAFMGVNARCEILAYLLATERGSPRAMARDCYYFPATVTKALAEMTASGFLVSRTEGRHRHYQLVPDSWRTMLVGSRPTSWVVWGRLFSALDPIWQLLWREDLEDKSPLAQASILRRLLTDTVTDRLCRSGVSTVFIDNDAYPAESLIPHFMDWMSHLFQELDQA